MTEETVLDTAHAAMQADLEDDGARLAFYGHLADGELFLLLKEESRGESVNPELFELEAGEDAPPDRYVLVFDQEDRLAAFAEGPAPYAALPGRVIAAMVAGSGIGLGVNLGVAPSSILIPAAAVDWLAQTLGPAPEEVEGQVRALEPPTGLSDRLITGLSTKLAVAAGLCDHAVLARALYDDQSEGLVLAFIDAAEGSESALARAAQEAMTFSGADQRLDVAFFASGDEVTTRLAKVGLRFDMPEPEPEPEAPSVRPAPGSDPSKPPILK
ncbi:SseB family protein [Maritimibacter sp. UBA3975]|uniref:SseB family protein n=1 Tax=Maritimibacter sp. UBA3975 TaxID=1946833 RepID=UPI000C09B806|nr:SseB family protein [Maritimibacter sp. UBA3975]MAM62531.1 hypothetical protein [Maritimibacter sp.]|tara:strand:- start:2357 stop:3169 length:813 start_codon:yes stop_codon:yes gene_type:complete